MSLDLTRPSPWTSRAITPENPTGARGQGGSATEGLGAQAASRLGRGWKISPCVDIGPGQTVTLADIDGPGLIRHLWCTTHFTHWRSLILRAAWDEAGPAIEVPLGDFFCQGWSLFSQVSSQMIAVNPNGGFNSYWPMPFRRHARLTLENVGSRPANVYWQVDYGLGPIADDTLYLHAQWRRSRPVADGVHTICDNVTGQGRYVGTYLAWQSNSPGWWGEGEVKMYLDGDTGFPTICGTGTEDYFGGAWNFDLPGQGYTEYTTPYLGLNQVLRPDGLYASQQRFGMYRWHVADDVAFRSALRVTIQALGIGPGQGNGLEHRYRTLADDVASTALFYLDSPTPSGAPPAPTLWDMEVA
jgi:hypothetical protein